MAKPNLTTQSCCCCCCWSCCRRMKKAVYGVKEPLQNFFCRFLLALLIFPIVPVLCFFSMGHMLIPFFIFWVHRIQVVLFNFLKNPFCYFSISSSSSKSPIRPIMSRNTQKSLPKYLFLMQCIRKIPSFWHRIFPHPPLGVRFRWATPLYCFVSSIFSREKEAVDKDFLIKFAPKNDRTIH